MMKTTKLFQDIVSIVFDLLVEFRDKEKVKGPRKILGHSSITI